MQSFMQAYGIYVVLAINLLIGWTLWSAHTAFASKSALAETDKNIAALAARVEGNEKQLAALPSKDDFHELQLQLTKTVGDLKTVSKLMQVERENLVNVMTRHEAVLARHDQIFADAARGGK